MAEQTMISNLLKGDLEEIHRIDISYEIAERYVCHNEETLTVYSDAQPISNFSRMKLC